MQAGGHFLHRFQETLERDGFQQVVRHVEFVAFQGILRVGRGEYDQRLFLQNFQERQPRDFGHIDVEEKNVHGILLQDLDGRQRTGAGLNQLQVRYFGHVLFHELAGHRLVVHNQAGVGHGSCRVSCTE